MSEVIQTAEEVMDSMTGHDEMAIAQHFGVTVKALLDDEFMLGRALIFVSKRHQDGVDDDAARNAALDMPFKAVGKYFADPSEETEEAGKGEQASEQPPLTSLTSVS